MNNDLNNTNHASNINGGGDDKKYDVINTVIVKGFTGNVDK